MNVSGRTAVVTGAAGGIGAAIGHRLLADGARVVFADRDERVEETAGGLASERTRAFVGDVSDVGALDDLLAEARAAFGPVDLFVANAGTPALSGLDTTEEEWRLAIDVNLLAHVRAARLLVPEWLERGEGYFLATASAAGLLTQVGALPYAVTKSAAIAHAEWLSVTYGSRGIRVSCLCPMGVQTGMLRQALESGGTSAVGARVVVASGRVLSPDVIAACVAEGIKEERFLILPHPEVAEFVLRKASDRDRWLAGMRRLQTRIEEMPAE